MLGGQYREESVTNMTKLTLKMLEAHQNETLATLDKEYEAQWKICQREMEKLSTITRAKAKFQTAIIMEKFRFLKPDQN